MAIQDPFESIIKTLQADIVQQQYAKPIELTSARRAGGIEATLNQDAEDYRKANPELVKTLGWSKRGLSEAWYFGRLATALNDVSNGEIPSSIPGFGSKYLEAVSDAGAKPTVSGMKRYIIDSWMAPTEASTADMKPSEIFMARYEQAAKEGDPRAPALKDLAIAVGQGSREATRSRAVHIGGSVGLHNRVVTRFMNLPDVKLAMADAVQSGKFSDDVARMMTGMEEHTQRSGWAESLNQLGSLALGGLVRSRPADVSMERWLGEQGLPRDRVKSLLQRVETPKNADGVSPYALAEINAKRFLNRETPLTTGAFEKQEKARIAEDLLPKSNKPEDQIFGDQRVQAERLIESYQDEMAEKIASGEWDESVRRRHLDDPSALGMAKPGSPRTMSNIVHSVGLAIARGDTAEVARGLQMLRSAPGAGRGGLERMIREAVYTRQSPGTQLTTYSGPPAPIASAIGEAAQSADPTWALSMMTEAIGNAALGRAPAEEPAAYPEAPQAEPAQADPFSGVIEAMGPEEAAEDAAGSAFHKGGPTAMAGTDPANADDIIQLASALQALDSGMADPFDMVNQPGLLG